MGLFRSLSGNVRVEIVSADIASVLGDIRKTGLELRNLEQKDSLTVTFDLRRQDVKKVRWICGKRGDSFRSVAKDGIFWVLRGLRRRPVLIAGMLLLLVISLVTPNRVLFVRVEGNVTVPTRKILEEAANCGIRLLASTREVRSEKVKNNLLSQIDTLQWAGINTYGCVAVISVKERAKEPERSIPFTVSSIFAQRDGIILSVVAQQGTALCKPGDAVTAGQKLISGYTDCGNVIQATQAKGEITALTEHELTAVAPINFRFRSETKEKSFQYALIIGKKRINFYKGSGILDTSCVRIYSEWYVTFPGGFILPLGLVRESFCQYEEIGLKDTDPADQLTAFADEYILQQTNAGQIVTSTVTTETSEGLLILHGHYACRELLGITRVEEKFEHYGQDP